MAEARMCRSSRGAASVAAMQRHVRLCVIGGVRRRLLSLRRRNWRNGAPEAKKGSWPESNKCRPWRHQEIRTEAAQLSDYRRAVSSRPCYASGAYLRQNALLPWYMLLKYARASEENVSMYQVAAGKHGPHAP